MNQQDLFSLQRILDSLNDGVYVTDKERRILYWSKSAEKITGWPEGEILGHRCCDNVLCHIDKDQHRLCGEEYCPLHRSMVTGERSTVPILLYARGRDGNRIPMQVSVAPVQNDSGEIIGGVETFRDFSEVSVDLERAKKIQRLSLPQNIPDDDPRIHFRTHYVPHDIIGGDFFAIEQIDSDRYVFFLADVVGHGIASALYTMFLKSLWEKFHSLRSHPRDFVATMNQGMCELLGEKEAFATGMYGLIDLSQNHLTLVGAGNPYPYLIRNGEQFERIKCPGLALGLVDHASYEETEIEIKQNDYLLFFTDGAFEIRDMNGNFLQEEGLIELFGKFGYPTQSVPFAKIEEELLKFSNSIRLDDDLTFLEIHFNS